MIALKKLKKLKKEKNKKYKKICVISRKKTDIKI